MLFHSSLRKDLGRNFWSSLVVLVSIVITVTLIRTLGQASRGRVNPAEVLQVMGFSVVSQLTTIMALSLFIAVVATMSRMYSDSEMVIWFSSGKGLGHFVRPLFGFAWPFLVMIFFLALFAWPWSNLQIHELSQRFEKRNDFERIAPGQFQESAGGLRVFFIDKDSPDNQVGKHVFISSLDGAMESVTTAQSGRINMLGNDRFLMLEKGQQWLTNRDTGETRLTQFEHYELLIDADVRLSLTNLTTHHKSTWQLIQSPTRNNLGELSWRLGLGLASFNLMLMALAVSAVNPRAGRSYHLALALFLFVVYFNMLNVGQSWISSGRLDFSALMLTLHGGFLLLASAWLAVRHANGSWRFLRVFSLPNRVAAA
jgi:lipopolysaccharide export system permease protein